MSSIIPWSLAIVVIWPAVATADSMKAGGLVFSDLSISVGSMNEPPPGTPQLSAFAYSTNISDRFGDNFGVYPTAGIDFIVPMVAFPLPNGMTTAQQVSASYHVAATGGLTIIGAFVTADGVADIDATAAAGGTLACPGGSPGLDGSAIDQGLMDACFFPPTRALWWTSTGFVQSSNLDGARLSDFATGFILDPSVPEPGTLGLFSIGLWGIALVGQRLKG